MMTGNMTVNIKRQLEAQKFNILQTMAIGCELFLHRSQGDEPLPLAQPGTS